MSKLTDKEQKLVIAVFKNITANITEMVDWHLASIDAGYKDAPNARVMWGRLYKKMMAARLTVTSHDSHENDDDAGEGPSDAPAKVPKKRKATGTRGGSSSAKVGRPTKKSKAAQAQSNASNNTAYAEAEGHSAEPMPSADAV